LYREAAAALSLACPGEDYKAEEPAAFCDGRGFDPEDPLGYLRGFTLGRERMEPSASAEAGQ